MNVRGILILLVAGAIISFRYVLISNQESSLTKQNEALYRGYIAEHINLNRAESLREIKEGHPEHYKMIVDILHEIPSLEASEVRGWLNMIYAASEVSIDDLTWLASYPPQKEVKFVLGATKYTWRFATNEFGVPSMPETMQIDD